MADGKRKARVRKTKTPLETGKRLSGSEGSPEFPLLPLGQAASSLLPRDPLLYQEAGAQSREGKLTSVGFLHDFRSP